MSNIFAELRNKFRNGTIVTQLIYINVAIFLIVKLATILLMLFNRSLGDVVGWFELPASPLRFIFQPWSLLTYMFLHDEILHILFNMLWLWWFGQLFLQYFSARHLRNLYLMGGIGGGALYILAFNTFPFFDSFVGGAMVLGASASVLAIVAATAYRAPEYRIQLLLIGAIRLKYLALIVFGLDVLSITGANAGGHIAHLGGALVGLLFAHYISRPRIKVMKPKAHKANYGSERQREYEYNREKKERNDEIDRILDKIKQSGYSSLSTEEKQALFNASKR